MACFPYGNAGSVFRNVKYGLSADYVSDSLNYLHHWIRRARYVQSTVYAIGANVDDRPTAMLFMWPFPIMAQVKNSSTLKARVV